MEVSSVFFVLCVGGAVLGVPQEGLWGRFCFVAAVFFCACFRVASAFFCTCPTWLHVETANL